MGVTLKEKPVFDKEMIVSVMFDKAITWQGDLPLDLAEKTLRHIYREEVGTTWGQGGGVDDIGGGFPLIHELNTQARAQRTPIGRQFILLLTREMLLRFISEFQVGKRGYIAMFLSVVFDRIDTWEMNYDQESIDGAVEYASSVMRKLASANGCKKLAQMRSRLPNLLGFDKKDAGHSTRLYFEQFSAEEE
jgi:hypothetical protein